MASRILSESITVDTSPDVVFAILADPRQHARIDGSGTVLEPVSGPERLSEGAEFGMSMKMGLPYTITNRVVEYDEGRRIAWRHMGGHRWRYELEPVDGGTRVTESFDYSHYPMLKAKAIEALGMPGRNARGIHETLAKLKVAAEQDAATAGV